MQVDPLAAAVAVLSPHASDSGKTDFMGLFELAVAVSVENCIRQL